MSATYDSSIRRSTPQIDRRPQIVVDRLALQLANRLFEQLHVHLEADRLDVAALLAAEQIPGAADLEIERRHAEAAAEIAELLDRRQPLLRDRREVVLGRNQQVRVGGPIRPADAAAQLIELREPVPIGAVDDDRVRVRDVEPVLDDGGRQQHVVLAGHEVEHRPLERIFAHLPVADDHARLGNQPLNQVADRENRFDAVVDEIDLPAARQLALNRAPDDLGIELDDVGLDRQPVLWRRLDDRHVADADERHVQRPRNRRRAHRQHVDLLLELLDLLLVADAEPLLFVDHEKPEIAELDVLRQQPMRADDDVDLAGGEIGERLLLLRLWSGSG